VFAGTTVGLEARTGMTADPAAIDSNWTPFKAMASGDAVTGMSRYGQYRVTVSTTVSNAAPALKELTVTFQK
jgi:hypothetical protein